MNNHERVRNQVNGYVKENGNSCEMSRGEFLEWVHQTYGNIGIVLNTFTVPLK